MVKSPKHKMVNKKYTFIDLFAGCGGLSEGFYRQGFKALAHVEIDHWACETLRTRMKFYGYKDYDKEVIEHDITSDDILERIDNVVNGRTVDIIIGGPPCQAYSTAGRVRDGKKMASPCIMVWEDIFPRIHATKNGDLVQLKLLVSVWGRNYPG